MNTSKHEIAMVPCSLLRKWIEHVTETVQFLHCWRQNPVLWPAVHPAAMHVGKSRGVHVGLGYSRLIFKLVEKHLRI